MLLIFLFLWRSYRSFYSYHILLLDLFHFQLLLHQTIGNSFQVLVISVSLLAQPFNGHPRHAGYRTPYSAKGWSLRRILPMNG